MGVAIFGAVRRHFADLEGFGSVSTIVRCSKPQNFRLRRLLNPLSIIRVPSNIIIQSAKENDNMNCNPLKRKASFQYQSVELSAKKLVQSAKQSVRNRVRPPLLLDLVLNRGVLGFRASDPKFFACGARLPLEILL